MATIKHGNFSHDRIADLEVNDGDRIELANLSQKYPNTTILTGKKNLEFWKCNLCNCAIDPTWTVIQSNNNQVSRCSNRHPEWNLSPPCAENCSHVVDVDTITIDGQLIDNIYHYKDTVQ
jgi:hypothetical protein